MVPPALVFEVAATVGGPSASVVAAEIVPCMMNIVLRSMIFFGHGLPPLMCTQNKRVLFGTPWTLECERELSVRSVLGSRHSARIFDSSRTMCVGVAPGIQRNASMQRETWRSVLRLLPAQTAWPYTDRICELHVASRVVFLNPRATSVALSSV